MSNGESFRWEFFWAPSLRHFSLDWEVAASLAFSSRDHALGTSLRQEYFVLVLLVYESCQPDSHGHP
jgi:hypothetical protein